MNIFAILIILLVIAAFGGLPAWGWHPYGWYPSGIVGLVVIILIIYLLLGRAG